MLLCNIMPWPSNNGDLTSKYRSVKREVVVNILIDAINCLCVDAA